MNIQILIASMNQTDHSLLEKMHIQTDAIVGNQCNNNSIGQFEWNGYSVKYLNFVEREVGLNRNNTLLRASADIVSFADEDVVLVDKYKEIVSRAFKELPQTDAIIFNTINIGGNRARRINHKVKRVRFYNALNYDTSRIAVRLNSIKRQNITFHSCFGGGTRYSSGEDTLLIGDMLKAGLKIYTYPEYVLTADSSSSTWFRGYDEKYLHDKGTLFCALSKRWALLLCIQDLIRHPYIYKESGTGLFKALKIMRKGQKHYKSLQSYEPCHDNQ